MRTKMDKEQLLKLLQTNREAHVVEFKETWEGFICTVIADTEDHLTTVKAGDTPKQWNLYWTLPISHEEDYDHAISMVEHNITDVIELGDNEFSNLVLDEWDWKATFTATSMYYKTS